MRRNHALLLAFFLLLCLTLTFVACKGKNNGKKPVGTTAATTVTTSPVEDPTDPSTDESASAPDESTGKQTEGAYSAYVQPTLVSATSLEAAVPANYNLITFEGEASGRMSFYGQGAGRYPTAHNVVQDCADVMAGKGFYSPYGETVRATNEDRLQFYVRGNADAWLQSHTSQNWGSGVVTTPVCVSEMHKWLKDHEEAFIAAIAE
jgi:hypothetical protein